MRRTMALLLGALLLLGLAGCKPAQTQDNIAFTGTVEEVSGASLLVTTEDDVGFDKASVRFSEDMAEPDFAFAVGQVLRFTILPQIAESYPVQVTAVAVELIAEPAPTDPGHPANASSFYRADGDAGGGAEYLWTGAENFSTIAISHQQHIPVHRFDDAAALAAFIEEADAYFQFDVSYSDDNPGEESLAEAFAKYDDAFFEGSRLLVIYMQERSGSIRHEIGDVAIQDGTLLVTVRRVVPEAGTDDMADWFLLLELGKVDTVACTAWDAIVVE